MTNSIAIHIKPDFDAIGAAWLLERFVLPGAEIRFIRSGQTDETATAVVDTGGELDETRLRFDHHQLTGIDADDSATAQVWYFLKKSGHSVQHLHELICLIDDCDLGKQNESANTSRRLGIHSLLSAKRAQNASDLELWQYGCSLLDDIAGGLLVRHNAQIELDENIEWADEDLGVCVLKHNASHGCSFAAYDAGYDLVFYSAQVESGGYVRGMMRRSGCTRYHCGEMVAQVLDYCRHRNWRADISGELSMWYQHPSGFFAGISEKGGAVEYPSLVSMTALASALLANLRYAPDPE